MDWHEARINTIQSRNLGWMSKLPSKPTDAAPLMQCIEKHEQIRSVLNTETFFTEKKQNHYLLTVTQYDRRHPSASTISFEGWVGGGGRTATSFRRDQNIRRLTKEEIHAGNHPS